MNDISRRRRGDTTLGAISITCPWCGSALRAALRDLRTAPTLTCPDCATTLELAPRPRVAIDRAAA